MAPLVGSDPAQLRRVELTQPLADLRNREVVVAGDWERGADADGPARAVGAADEPVDRFAAPGSRRRRIELLAAATEQAVDVTQELVGLLPPVSHEQRCQLVGVAARHPAALHRLLECLLDPLAAEDDQPQGCEDALDELLGQRGEADRRPGAG